MAFLEDPRIRQRWNQITQNAETATENAAAGIWTFQQEYINPCLAYVSEHVDQCTSLCLGDREERARRQRERERERAEYSFDFYDDWARDEGYPSYQGGVSVSGLLGSWSNDDWDRLLAGSSAARRYGDGVIDQPPRKKRGMSYGTRRRSTEQDPTVIPSTQPIGFLGRLPWKIGGTLRYKPSAADLQDHPFRPGQGEREALLDRTEEEEYFQGTEQPIHSRARRNTTGSRATSGSYRSRGDLFPSDGEGDEDAVPLGDEFTVEFDRSDDRSSNRTRSSKGKYPVGARIPRTVSRNTVASGYSTLTSQPPYAPASVASTSEEGSGMASLEDLGKEEERLQKAKEEQENEVKRQAAVQHAQDRARSQTTDGSTVSPRGRGRRPKPEVTEDAVYIATTSAKKPAVVLPRAQQPAHMEAQIEETETVSDKTADIMSDKPEAKGFEEDAAEIKKRDRAPMLAARLSVGSPKEVSSGFVPARLPRFD